LPADDSEGDRTQARAALHGGSPRSAGCPPGPAVRPGRTGWDTVGSGRRAAHGGESTQVPGSPTLALPLAPPD
jgi:hypothetical protein